MSVTPSFWFSQLCWLEQGGIFAIASIRGGGEYGEAWHRTAVCERKQTSADDLISGAKWLIEQGYSANASPHPIMMADIVSGDLHGRVSMQSARYWSSCFKHSSLNLFLHGYGNSIGLPLE